MLFYNSNVVIVYTFKKMQLFKQCFNYMLKQFVHNFERPQHVSMRKWLAFTMLTTCRFYTLDEVPHDESSARSRWLRDLFEQADINGDHQLSLVSHCINDSVLMLPDQHATDYHSFYIHPI